MLAITFSLLSRGQTAEAQPADGRISVFVGSATLAPGERTSIDLVVRLDADHALDEFAISLSFDARLITVNDIKLDRAWIAAETGAPTSTAGQLTLSGLHAEGACAAGSSCRLATISVTGTGSGEALVELTRVLLLEGGVPLPDPAVSPGRLQLGGRGASAGAASPANGTVAGVRGPGAAPGTPSQPEAGSSGPNSSIAAGLGVFIALAVVLVGGSALIVSLVRRSWRWSSRGDVPGAGVATALHGDPTALADQFSEYLARVEAFGRVVGKAGDEDEALVRDVATAFANRRSNVPHANGTPAIDRPPIP